MKRVFLGSEQLGEQHLLNRFRSEWRTRYSIFEKKLLGYLVKIENGWSDKKVYKRENVGKIDNAKAKIFAGVIRILFTKQYFQSKAEIDPISAGCKVVKKWRKKKTEGTLFHPKQVYFNIY